MQAPRLNIGLTAKSAGFGSIHRALATLLGLCGLFCLSAAAQAQGVAFDARISSVRGPALISHPNKSPMTVAHGETVSPGDQIDTRAGGRVAIELVDGSLVIVQPGTLVILQNYNGAGSLRDLLQIVVGHVRIRINHWGGRPNPYRINSPTASIAVRGTEFSVTVENQGETQVVVYEGMVEVSSFANPAHPVLVQPGHGVLVRPNEDIQFFVPGPNTEVGSRSNKRPVSESETDTDLAEQDSDETLSSKESLRSAAGAHQRYFQTIVANGELPLASQFTAFADSYADSVENPAYATEFRGVQGQIFLVPSIGGTQQKEGVRELLGLGEPRLVDYSISPQLSVFANLPKYRAVIGARVAWSNDGQQSLSLDDNVRLIGPVFPVGSSGSRSIDGTTRSSLGTISLIAGRRFGNDGRTSAGVEVDYLNNKGSLLNTVIQRNSGGLTSREEIDTASIAKRTRVTLGMTREFKGGAKLGVYYRYGFVTAQDYDRSRTVNGVARSLNTTSLTGRVSEVGFRFRNPVSRHFVYGLEGSYFFENSDGRIRRSRVTDSNLFADTNRASLGLGLGYIPRPGIVFGFDLSGGLRRNIDRRIERATGNLLEDSRKTAPFLSAHAAVQANVGRRSFLSASVLTVNQSQVGNLTLLPDRFGRRVTSKGISAPNGRTNDSFTDYFGSFGAGWRFTHNLQAEYILSTDFGQTAVKHTLLLRYTFSRNAGF